MHVYCIVTSMRMWMVNPRRMCRKHLLGEHVECHMFLASLLRGRDVSGHYELGQLETWNIKLRHDALAAEITRRGYRHQSPMSEHDVRRAWRLLEKRTGTARHGRIVRKKVLLMLIGRCADCRKLHRSRQSRAAR